MAGSALDTDAAVDDLVVQRWRSMSSAERAQRVAELNADCERMAEIGVRRRHPGVDEHEVRLRTIALRLGRDLMVEVYGWDPDVEGW